MNGLSFCNDISRVNQVSVHQNNPNILGMIKKVSHLLRIESQDEYEARLAKRIKDMQWKSEIVIRHNNDE